MYNFYLLSLPLILTLLSAAGPLITFDTDNIQFNGGDRNINVGLLFSLN